MKRREGLIRVARLCRLLSNSGGGNRVGSYVPQLPHQICFESSSNLDDSPLDPPSNIDEKLSNGRIIDRVLSSSFVDLRTSNFIFPFATCQTSLSGSPHVGLVRCSRVYSFCSSAHIFNRWMRVSAVPFATLREKWQEDKQEIDLEGHEKLSPSEPWSQGQRETQTIDTGRGARPEKPFIRDKVSESEVLIGDEKPKNKSHEDARREVRWSEMGWSREEILNWPNAISMARLFCGPLLSWMILHQLWGAAFVGLVIAGISDWLDGYMARKLHINSVLGSYLDPVADKFLVGSVAISMAYIGLLHPALVGLIVARDGVLMGGAFLYRAYSLRWQWNDWQEFFRISLGGAQKVEPLFISKVNTVFQLALVGVALLQPALSIEDTYSIVPVLSWSVVVTTSVSWAAYVYIYWKNPMNLAALRHAAHAPGPRAP